MATFLQLVNDLERESGTVYQAQRVVTVTAPAGRHEKMVEWVREAWSIIQMARTDWRWQKDEFTAALVPGQLRYDASDFGIADFAGWPRQRERALSPFTIYDPAIGPRDENEIVPFDYDEWRRRWDRGVHDPLRPLGWAVDTKDRLCIGPASDNAYVIRGEYRCTKQILTADTDVPRCPVDFHPAILWRALMLMAAHDEATAVYNHANSVFIPIFRALVEDSAGQML